MNRLCLFTAGFIGLLWGSLPVAGATNVSLRVYPPRIQLDHARDSQSFIVVTIDENAVVSDVTKSAKVVVGEQAKLTNGVLTPVGDGETELSVEWNGQRATIPVTVRNSGNTPPVSFRTDIIPVFTKVGCNSGRCHGAARGKDGFRLSLFGYDPEGDHFRISREIPGRRVNLAQPDHSLIIRKATGEVVHTGGELFPRESDLCRVLAEWLNDGAPNDDKQVPEPVALEIHPPEAVMVGEGKTQQLTIRAKYPDGTDRDVTRLAIYLSNNDNSADVSHEGLVKAGKRGEAFVMARFGTITVGAPFIVLPEGVEHTFPAEPNSNYVDDLINRKLRKLRMSPSEIGSDESFLRRIHIDLVGRLPSREQYEQFIQARNPSKRDLLIDHLLEQDDFVDMWTMKWAELLRIRTANEVSFKALYSYHHWLGDRIKRGVPLNQIVTELLSSNGSTFQSPSTNYYQIESNKQVIAENVAQVFMGNRIQCAQCHNHPFDRWTMNDYYGFLAFFGQIGFKQSDDPREFIIYNTGRGETRHLVDQRVMAPKFLGGDLASVDDRDYRLVLAEWISSPRNPYFARNVANIIWSQHFGRGIIEPVDDVRVSNPASNPELLQALADHLIEYGYDFKRLVRDICRSRTYQRSTHPNATNRSDEANFARAQVRRIRAEVLLDCLSQVTQTADRFPNLPAGARAIKIVDGSYSNYFMTTFGRATRQTVCSCEVDVEPNLSQAFHLLNGETTNGKIEEGGRIARLLEYGKDVSGIFDDLYVSCYGRFPSDDERKTLIARVEASADKQEVLEDVFWAILNSKEFIFNH